MYSPRALWAVPEDAGFMFQGLTTRGGMDLSPTKVPQRVALMVTSWRN